MNDLTKKITLAFYVFVLTLNIGCNYSYKLKPGDSKESSGEVNKSSGERRSLSWPDGTPPDSMLIKDGLVLWLDANDVNADSIFDTHNLDAKLDRWKDKSISGNVALQPSSQSQPKAVKGNSENRKDLKMLYFDGNQSFSLKNIPKGRTFFWVLNPDDNCAANTHFGHTEIGWGTTWNRRMFHGLGTTNSRINGVRAPLATFDNSWGGPLCFYSLRLDDFKDFSLIGCNYTQINPSTVKDGSKLYFFKGLIGEIIVYSKILTDSETSEVENYLSQKWGIPKKTSSPINPSDLYKP